MKEMILLINNENKLDDTNIIFSFANKAIIFITRFKSLS